MSNELSHVHITTEPVSNLELTPAHPPRVETPLYQKSHDYLVHTLDSPCWACGVRQSTLSDPSYNLFGATAMETHHYPIERSLMDACDPNKVHQKFSSVIDKATLEAFIDSPSNLVILCDVHHRSLALGIHHLIAQDFAVQPFLYTGYHVVGNSKNSAELVHANDIIEQAQGYEPAVMETVQESLSTIGDNLPPGENA